MVIFIVKTLRELLLFSPFLMFCSCPRSVPADNKGIVQQITQFYNKKGEVTFIHYLKILYRGSLAIEEIRGVNTVTDTTNITTVSYPLLFCRYIDTENKLLYDYKNFSDTAKIIHIAILPDSLLLDGGWSFYSEKAPKIRESPEILTDTVIKDVTYKRAKFCFTSNNPHKSFMIGYSRCDGKTEIFSLEKDYSRKWGCTLVRYDEYHIGSEKPFASIEIKFLADHLSAEEEKVFTTWQKNAKENPVNKK